jgi:glycosyltransferase involved in cell wall biosynthesis
VTALTLLYNDRGNSVDGIRDHTNLLGATLAERGALDVAVETRFRPSSLESALDRAGSSVILQYSPFCYGRWGFAPWLPAALLRLRRRRPRPTIALLVHEPFVPIVSARSFAMGAWQRLQLEALRLASDVVFASIESWAARLGRRRPSRPVLHLPVGSNVPDMRGAREKQRRALGVSDDTLVVASCGRRHPGWRGDYVSAAMRRIADTGTPALMLSLGADAPPFDDLGDIPLHAPGRLSASELASHFAAADLFLAPFVDGVSTRRGTLMAALQHGLPVLGTDGHLTDGLFRQAPDALRLTPAGQPAAFADAAGRLAVSRSERADLGRRGRSLYERLFDWPVTVDKVLAALTHHAVRRS